MAQHDGVYTTLENDATHRDKIEMYLEHIQKVCGLVVLEL